MQRSNPCTSEQRCAAPGLDVERRTPRVYALSVCAALFGSAANASPVSYTLTQSNVDSSLPDGTAYAQVDIDDSVYGSLRFDVSVLPSLTTIAGSNFGIDNFAFNLLKPGYPTLGDAPSAQWGLPSGWTANVAPPANQADGFGRFDVQVDGSGQTRLSTLTFYLYGTGLTAQDFAKSSTNGNGQGNVFFAAHAAGFSASGNVSSGYFGGSEVSAVPLPAGIWLLLSGLGGVAGLTRRRNLLCNN